MGRIRLSDHFTYRRLIRFTIPSIAMMVFVSVYGAVDGLFVSNFVGTTAFASLNLIMPFIMVISATGFMMGAGGSAIIGKTFGEGNDRLAQEYFSFFVLVTLVAGVILSILGVIFMRPISILLGAEGDMIDQCVVYGDISMISMPMFMIQYVFQSFFIVAEKPAMGFKVTVAAGCTNMVLDYVFIALIGMGIEGAAWATVIGEYVGGLIPIVYFARKNDSTLKFVKTRFYGRALGKACTNGCSEFVSNVAMSLISIVFNLQLIKYAGENGVAAYGVLMYVQFMFGAILIGYCAGVAKVISYSYGARTHSELKNLFRKSATLMGVCGLTMAVLGFATAVPVSEFFVGYDPVLLDMTVRGFRIFAVTFVFMGIGCFGSSLFTALNNGIISAVISMVRTFVFRLSAVLLLPLVLGLDGIWLSTCCAEALGFILTLIFFAAYRKKYHYL